MAWATGVDLAGALRERMREAVAEHQRRMAARRAEAAPAYHLGGTVRAYRAYRDCPVCRGPDADERARQTLLRLLSPEQRHQFEATGGFGVTGSAGGLYEVHAGQLDRLHGGYRVSLCVYAASPTLGIPPACDQMLALKLALETDEPGVLREAIAYAYGPDALHGLDRRRFGRIGFVPELVTVDEDVVVEGHLDDAGCAG